MPVQGRGAPATTAETVTPCGLQSCYWAVQGECLIHDLHATMPELCTRILAIIPTAKQDLENCRCPEKAKLERSRPART